MDDARCLLREHHEVRSPPFLTVKKLKRLTYPRPWLQSLTGKMRGKPLLDLVGSVVEDYEYLWENYYFSTTTL